MHRRVFGLAVEVSARRVPSDPLYHIFPETPSLATPFYKPWASVPTSTTRTATVSLSSNPELTRRPTTKLPRPPDLPKAQRPRARPKQRLSSPLGRPHHAQNPLLRSLEGDLLLSRRLPAAGLRTPQRAHRPDLLLRRPTLDVPPCRPTKARKSSPFPNQLLDLHPRDQQAVGRSPRPRPRDPRRQARRAKAKLKRPPLLPLPPKNLLPPTPPLSSDRKHHPDGKDTSFPSLVR